MIMTREIIFEPASELNNQDQGWTAYDGQYRDPIPNTTSKSSFEEAVEAAVAAWGESWADSVQADFDDSCSA